MAEVNASEALEVLKNTFGEELGGTRDEGLKRMQRVLREHFAVSAAEAGEMLEALEQGRMIQWLEGTAGDFVVPGAPFAETAPMSATTNPHVDVGVEGGYWQIGGG